MRCKKHNIQGVGCTTELKKRISNYQSHHNKRNISWGITKHFLEEGHEFEKDFMIKPPRTVTKRRERLEKFEIVWQEDLVTYDPMA